MQSHNPYQSPQEYSVHEDDNEYEYAGFWIRVAASIVDSLIFSLVFVPIVVGLGIAGVIDLENQQMGMIDVVLQAVSMAIYIFFWVKYAGTPGKRIFKLKVLDAKTGDNISVGQAILRYLGYIPSAVVLLLGFIWVGFDKQKQGWHDKIAKTVVVREV